MRALEAQIIIDNLLERIVPNETGQFTLSGALTTKEIAALKFAVGALDGANIALDVTDQPVQETERISAREDQLKPEERDTYTEISTEEPVGVDLILDVLEMPKEESSVRVCLDFGTAMSKATLVVDERKDLTERIEVLELGLPGDQREINEHMLVSSVYISDDGKLWFGQHAVTRAEIECHDGSRQRLDNIKRWLSEDGIEEKVSSLFNPTEVGVTYGDMVQAYLMFLTWAMNDCVESLGFNKNIRRRFAMPCFTGDKERETAHFMRKMLGQAQILADSFSDQMMSGILLEDFVLTLEKVRSSNFKYDFIDDYINEPLGVAGSLMSWQNSVNSLVLVIDVGAGTSDFSLFRIRFDPETGKSTSSEVDGSSRAITEAGNHLDKLLNEYILLKGEVTSDNPIYINIRGALSLGIRDNKESLFRDGFVHVPLFGGEKVVEVELAEFLELEPVQTFGQALKDTMADILEVIDSSWIRNAPFSGLGVALTGGGADLPMVQKLAEGDTTAQNVTLRLSPTSRFPIWLEDEYPELEDEYPRIAVSLGGARKQFIARDGTARSTGERYSNVTLGGYFTKG